MKEDQKTIGDWIEATFPGGDPASSRKAIRALEEMVELCLAAGATPDQISGVVSKELHKRSHGPGYVWRGESYAEPDKVGAEAADVLIVLYGLAALKGFDIHAEVDRKMIVNRPRLWMANGDGTGYHIKTGGAPK